MKRRFHVSSCGRSGSMFLAQALQHMGFSVIHEQNRTWPLRDVNISYFRENPHLFKNYDGFVGWKWALMHEKLVASLDVQLHMVRAPLNAIISATTHSPGLFTTVEKKLGAPDFIPADAEPEIVMLGRAVNYWIRYNKAFAQNKPVFRVEDFREGGESLRIFCDHTGTPPEAGKLMAGIPTNVNARPKGRRVKATWKMLDRLFPRQADTLRAMGQEYGYDIS